MKNFNETEYKLYKYLPYDKREEALKDWFIFKTGEKLNLQNPETYNEKIQWMKLYYKNPLLTQLSDKVLVRDWIKEKIGEKYLIKLFGVWNNFNDIDFSKLPNQFVLKTNHGSGFNLIVNDKNKIKLDEIEKQFNNWLNIDYSFVDGFEMHYHGIKPKILAEEYIADENGCLDEYKFWCFNGEVAYINLVYDRDDNGAKEKFYDINWVEQDFTSRWSNDSRNINKPINLDEMIYIARTLSRNFIHVRVDLYNNYKGIKFGEMTFTTGSGTSPWNPKEYNKKLGDLIILPNIQSF